MEPAVGQIWKEVDPRFVGDEQRYIRIESTRPDRIYFRTVIKKEGDWVEAPWSRASRAQKKRFNGKRGGYEFHASE